jgi:hypothetical protein
VSWIMERLRRVEGASLSERAAARSNAGPQPGDSHRLEEETRPVRGAGWGRIMASLLILSVALIAWRVWNARNRATSTEGRQSPPRQAHAAPGGEKVNPASSRTLVSLVGDAVESERSSGEENVRLAASPVADRSQPGPAPSTPDVIEAGAPEESHARSPAVVASERPTLESSPPGTGELPQQEKVATTRVAEAAKQTLTPEEDEKTKKFLLSLKVSGVYGDADGYVALINGRELQEGSMLGRIEITEIASERITFGFKGKRYHLPIR